MPYTDEAKNGMLDGKPLRQRITHLSIHTANPGLTGADEVASGAYARVAVGAVDFVGAAAGELVLGGDQAFVAAPNEAATFFGAWDGASFLGGGGVTGDVAFNAEGEFVLKAGTSFDLNAA